MEGSERSSQGRRVEELEEENRCLREKLKEAEEEIDRLQEDNARLRRELKAAGRTPKPAGRRKPKTKHKRSGRKAGQGQFTFRQAPAASAAPPEAVEVPVTETRCPFCGGELKWERTDPVTVTDIPPDPQPEVKAYAVEVRRCERCDKHFRGQHPDGMPDQYGATAHRLGPRVKAAAHAMHYGLGVPARKVPAILREFTGIVVTQSALTQEALKKAEGAVGNAYQELRAEVPQAPAVYTDDTGWRIHGQPAQLMGFDTDQVTVFQIRDRHRNEEVRELIPADYPGTLVTDRGRSYEAEELSAVAQQKCLDHRNRNIDEVLEVKTGRARRFGQKLKGLLREARQLWRDQRAGQAGDFRAQAKRIEQDLTDHLRHRMLKDVDNQRLLDGIGYQHDLGRLLRFLHDPAIEPTNNRGERILRFAVIARGLFHGSKNRRGAEAFSAFSSVIQTEVKRGAPSITNALQNLLRPNSQAPPLG